VFFIHSAADLTEEFGGDADITGDLVLGDTLGDQGVFFHELEVAFFGCLGDGGVETLLQDAECALDHYSEHTFEGRYLFEEPAFAFVVDRKEFAIFDGLYKEIGWFLFGKAGQVAYPPVFYGEQEDGLDSVLVDVITPDATFQDKGLEVAGLSFLEEKGLFPDFFVSEQSMEEAELFFGQLDVFGDKPVDGFVHGLIFNEFSKEKIKFDEIYRMV